MKTWLFIFRLGEWRSSVVFDESEAAGFDAVRGMAEEHEAETARLDGTKPLPLWKAFMHGPVKGQREMLFHDKSVSLAPVGDDIFLSPEAAEFWHKQEGAGT